MTYEEFKNYLVTFLWKDGDQVLKDSLDALITMADSDLNTDLNAPEREGAFVPVIEDRSIALPADFFKVRVVSIERLGECGYIRPSEMTIANENAAELQLVYTLIGGGANTTLLLAGEPPVNEPLNLSVLYQRRIPNFQALDASWMTDTYLSLYVYAVLKHAAAFLREDDRIAGWANMYQNILDKTNSDIEFHRRRGPTGDMPLPRQASADTYRSWRNYPRR